MIKRSSFLVIALLIAIPCALVGQVKEPPFWNEIKAFKKSDSLHLPPPNQILFVGSSSFTFWKDVQNYFPDYPILNRGFGGSTLVDLIFYFDAVIKPYHPRQIVIYCGENDFAYNELLGVDSVVNRFTHLFSMIRANDKNARITYVSMKPSPSRRALLKKYNEANRGIKKFLERHKSTSYIDVYHPMYDLGGTIRKDIFLKDSLHMNAKGYVIWQKEMKPYLLKK